MTLNLKLAYRNFLRNKKFSVLNFVGLAISLTITVFLLMFIVFEVSFDSLHKEKGIYRVLNVVQLDDVEETWCISPNALAPAIKKQVPGIEYVGRLYRYNFGKPAFVKFGNTGIIEKNFYFGDNDLIKLFDLKLQQSSTGEPLSQPNTVIISRSFSDKHFNGNALDQILTIDKTVPLKITGIFEDLPGNSSLDFTILASMVSTPFATDLTWSNLSFETYCKVAKNVSKTAVETAISKVARDNATSSKWLTIKRTNIQDIGKIHLYSSSLKNSYVRNTGDINELTNFIILALLILAMACINYMNLATAQYQQRLKEISISKILGATKIHLIKRYYVETAFIVLLAIALGFGISLLTFNKLESLFGRPINLASLLSPGLVTGTILLAVLTTLVAGSYPAFNLLFRKPKSYLKPTIHSPFGTNLFRNFLIIFQFSASIFLIIGVLFIHKQMKFIQTKSLGYNSENVLAIVLPQATEPPIVNSLQNSLRNLDFVLSAAEAQGFPGTVVSGRKLFKNADDNAGLDIQTNNSSSSIIDVLDLKLLSGSTLPLTKNQNDTTVQVILNKSAINYLGLAADEAVGKKVNMQLGNNAYIVGVVEDFNFNSLHTAVGPYAFHNDVGENHQYLLVKYKTKEVQLMLQKFKKVYSDLIPETGFDYLFLDEKVESLYLKDLRTQKIFSIFSVLAIIIASVGLLGIVAFTTNRRIKEIGIRKVLGAGTATILMNVARQYITQIIIAYCIAAPLALYFVNDWLNDFSYRISLSWIIFFLAGFSILALSMFIIFSQVWQVVKLKPAESLRTE